MAKHFDFIEAIPSNSKIQEDRQDFWREKTQTEQALKDAYVEPDLKCVPGRVIIKVDLEQKNWTTFADGTTIRIERDYENLDRKYTQQVLGIVIHGENIPSGAILLFHHNSTHETYQVQNHKALSGEEIASGIKIFSILERDCFFWKMPNDTEWNPTKGFEKALRIYKKYEGLIEGIEPSHMKDYLYVLTGELKGNIVKTLKASDYTVTFRNEKGVDESIIRFRPYGNEEEHREPEAICIMNNLNEQLKQGKILVGLNTDDAKPLNEYYG